MLGNPLKVVRRVIGNDDHAVLRGEKLLRQVLAFEPDLVVAHGGQHGNMGVAIRDECAATLKQLHDFKRGRLARVVDVLLVSDAKNANTTPLDRLAGFIERFRHPVDDIFGHGGVDLARQLDKARVHAELSRHPREIEGVDRNAVPA